MRWNCNDNPKIVCGGHLSAGLQPRRLFSHAKYGDANYDNKEDCDWIIEAPAGRNVHLSFASFEMEDEQDCGYDYIEVFSGYDDQGPSYGRFCGNAVGDASSSTADFFSFDTSPQIPPEILSVDEALLLRFKSDDTINSKGFSASYVVLDDADNYDYDR